MTTIVVNVTDTNEHRPRFPQDLYSARVFENAIVGDTVLTVRVCSFRVRGTWVLCWILTCLPPSQLWMSSLINTLQT